MSRGSGRPHSRGRQAVAILREDGMSELTRRVVRRLNTRVGNEYERVPMFANDVADSTRLQLPPRPEPKPDGTPLTIGWITAPPAAGSGGHTTMLRMVEAFERAGHKCVLYLYDWYGSNVDRHEQVIRGWWPNIRADVRDVMDGVGECDVYVATSWTTAHVLASRVTAPALRYYLVQDFEPFFYARGSEYALAEDTYRFGFQHVTVGHMVADVLKANVGVDSLVLEFGCDRSIYRLTNPQRRKDVVFYVRPDTPRRGYALGVLALERFHERHPESTIHTFGMAAGELTFPTVAHGRLHPTQLNEIYNQCAAGLALSFTNVSLIAQELLAAGAVPVVNDSPYTRADLFSDNVGWAAPTPQALADALSAAVEGVFAEPTCVSESVADLTWEAAQSTFLEHVLGNVSRVGGSGE